MSIYDDEQELYGEEMNNLLAQWMKKQTPWNLQDAIYLLIRKNPDNPTNKNHRISFAEKNMEKLETRAFTHILKSFADPEIRIYPIGEFVATATPEERKVAVDYLVDRDDFIEWADKEWDDNVDHLTAAHKQYKKTSPFKKPHKTAIKSMLRANAHEEAVQELRSKYTASERVEISYDEFHDLMVPILKPKKQTIYSKSRLYEYFANFLEQ